MTATVLLSVLVLIALLAPRYGADSRSLRNPPHYTATPAGDLRALRRRLRGRRQGSATLPSPRVARTTDP